MGEEKASRSRGYWQSVLSSPEYHKEDSERAAIEAMLCYHGYWWTGNNKVINIFKSKFGKKSTLSGTYYHLQ